MNDINADELAQACAASMYKRDFAVQKAGITLDIVKPGYACLEMEVREDMVNGHNVCHGGYLFLLADTAFAYACNSYNKVTYAQSCDIDFIEAAKSGEKLIAVAEECKRGRRTGVYDATISRVDGEILAYFRGRSYQVKGEVIQE
ncbi:MAG: hydroxyphenylacetyl-CoA thioesterase PaaI [Gammaproteobacteria bacterium]|nr:hydroxyphenylacetyl-CoA thioesterase PaaI [Gammaproteobacteria bacterium]